MRVLAIADKGASKPIKEILSENKIDLIITLGDLDYFELRELEEVNDIPKIGVYGNHCSGTYFKSLEIQNLHLQTFELNGMIFGGFEGSVRYKKSRSPMFTQDEASELLRDFPKVDVFISHAPPFGVNDEPSDNVHQGFRAIREYVSKNQPKYLFHGHTYPSTESIVTKLEETEIFYVHGEKILDL